jgi:hypothetical protein
MRRKLIRKRIGTNERNESSRKNSFGYSLSLHFLESLERRQPTKMPTRKSEMEKNSYCLILISKMAFQTSRSRKPLVRK